MNAKTMLGEIALAVWRLSEAERHERTAANHRREAAILGKAHSEFTAALVTAQKREKQPTPATSEG